MSVVQTTVLGAIAGFTIYLGLPIGRLRTPLAKLKTALNSVAVGVLVFLLWDVLTHAWERIDQALGAHRIGAALGNGLVLADAFSVGLLGLVWVDRHGMHNSAEGLAIGLRGNALPSTIDAPIGVKRLRASFCRCLRTGRRVVVHVRCVR